jgi:hypothetical protein
MLTRYWFCTADGLCVGVTARTLNDAHELLAFARTVTGAEYAVVDVQENVDVRTLDQEHVVPNMGPASNRGVWFPALGLPR